MIVSRLAGLVAIPGLFDIVYLFILPYIIHPSRVVEGQTPSLIDNIFSNKDWNGHLVKPLRREICKEGDGPKLSYTSLVSGNKVVGAFKLPE